MHRPVEIEYVRGRFRRLAPIPLPPPAKLYSPFSTSSESSDLDLDDLGDRQSINEEMLTSLAAETLSKRANHHQSDITFLDDRGDLSSDDEEDDSDPNNEVQGS